MFRRMILRTALMGLSFLCVACGGATQTSGTNAQNQIDESPDLEPAPFDADSAYSFIERQVAFGPRVPGSKGHELCGKWITTTLRSWGYSVIEQPVKGIDYHGKPVVGRNIIATKDLDAPERILLMAHWDTRAVADQDPDSKKRSLPILGADDGGSGVAVLLELARLYRNRVNGAALDFVFFDLEDGGHSGSDESWCQGSRYWAKHPHQKGYTARYGILVDMVGARGAKFYWEHYSYRYAAPIVRQLWTTARKLGWREYFIPEHGAAIMDDHVPVIEYRGIPSVDIVNFNPDGQFGPHWHTHADNLDNIDRQTLRAVGETIATTLRDYAG